MRRLVGSHCVDRVFGDCTMGRPMSLVSQGFHKPFLVLCWCETDLVIRWPFSFSFGQKMRILTQLACGLTKPPAFFLKTDGGWPISFPKATCPSTIQKTRTGTHPTKTSGRDFWLKLTLLHYRFLSFCHLPDGSNQTSSRVFLAPEDRWLGAALLR